MADLIVTGPSKWRYLDLAIAQIVVGLNVVIAKILIGHMPAFVYIELRFLLSTVLAGLFFFFSKSRLQLADHDKKHSFLNNLCILSALSLTGGVLFNGFMTFGLKYTSAANAGVISATLPAIVVAFSVWLLKERMNRWMAAAVVLAIAGVVILNMEEQPIDLSTSALLGNSIVFLAMIPEAFYTILNKITSKRFSALGIAFYASLLASIFSLPCLFFTEFSMFNYVWTWQVAGLLIASAWTALFFYWFWARGLEEVKASTAALFGGLMPLAAVLAGISCLGESFGLWQMAGMALVLASIVIGARAR